MFVLLLLLLVQQSQRGKLQRVFIYHKTVGHYYQGNNTIYYQDNNTIYHQENNTIYYQDKNAIELYTSRIITPYCTIKIITPYMNNIRIVTPYTIINRIITLYIMRIITPQYLTLKAIVQEEELVMDSGHPGCVLGTSSNDSASGLTCC